MTDTDTRTPPTNPKTGIVIEARRIGCRVRLEDIHAKVPGAMLCTCWCEQSLMYVTPADVLNGRTLSCGREGCQPK